MLYRRPVIAPLRSDRELPTVPPYATPADERRTIGRVPGFVPINLSSMKSLPIGELHCRRFVPPDRLGDPIRSAFDGLEDLRLQMSIWRSPFRHSPSYPQLNLLQVESRTECTLSEMGKFVSRIRI